MGGTSATVTLNGNQVSCPVRSGSVGPDVIDIRKLYAQTGAFTFDPGFTSTASCDSAITYIDGDKGILRYRGIPIEELAEKSDFEEVAYLLIYGDLPKKNELEKFRTGITRSSLIHEDMKHFFYGYPSSAHPMAILSAMVTASSWSWVT